MKAVTINALIKRINRRLSSQGECIRTTRGERAAQDLGWYWLQDINRNLVLAKFVDVQALGRELGVLKVTETVVS